eukprot:jgi/Bigna1/145996/aug1.107_g20704
MSCPVHPSNRDPKLADMMAEYSRLLPDCSPEAHCLAQCREKVASASVFSKKFLWRVGIGRGHCVPESETLSSCRSSRNTVSKKLMKDCNVPGGSLRGTYHQCLKNEEASQCLTILEKFLACVKESQK